MRLTVIEYVISTVNAGVPEGSTSETIELVIIEMLSGNVIYNQRFKPQNDIPHFVATTINISNEDVKNAPSFSDEYDTIASILKDSKQYFYDIGYNVGMLDKTAIMHDKPSFDFSQGHCVKSEYAEKFDHRRPANTFIKRLSGQTGRIREFGLTHAAIQQGIKFGEHNQHDGPGRAEITRRLISAINSPNFRYSEDHINRMNINDSDPQGQIVSRLKTAITNTPEAEANFNLNEGKFSPILLVHSGELTKTPYLDAVDQRRHDEPTSIIKKTLRDYSDLTDQQMTYILANEIEAEFGITLDDDNLIQLRIKIGAHKGSSSDQIESFVEELKYLQQNASMDNEPIPSPIHNGNNIEHKRTVKLGQ